MEPVLGSDSLFTKRCARPTSSGDSTCQDMPQPQIQQDRQRQLGTASKWLTSHNQYTTHTISRLDLPVHLVPCACGCDRQTLPSDSDLLSTPPPTHTHFPGTPIRCRSITTRMHYILHPSPPAHLVQPHPAALPRRLLPHARNAERAQPVEVLQRRLLSIRPAAGPGGAGLRARACCCRRHSSCRGCRHGSVLVLAHI